MQDGCDNYPCLLASDSLSTAAEGFDTRSKLIEELNNIVPIRPGRLRIACVFECCRTNSQDSCFTTRGPANRKLLSRLKNDFYTIFACDPGREAVETEQGGTLATQLLRLLPYKAPISQIFYEAARQVGHQRAWVEARPGEHEPVLGDLPANFPVLLGNSDGNKTEVPQVGDDSSITRSWSDCDILRLHWAPGLALSACFFHGTLLLLWILGLVGKRYATRLAVPPGLSCLVLALVLQRDDEEVPSWGRGTDSLRYLWGLLDKYTMNGWMALCFFLLSLGEIIKEKDWIAAFTSWILAIASICVNDSKRATIASLRARSSDSSLRRNAGLWLCVCVLSVYLAGTGHHILVSNTDAAEDEVETNFHFFMLIFAAALYISLVHDSDPGLSRCSSSNPGGFQIRNGSAVGNQHSFHTVHLSVRKLWFFMANLAACGIRLPTFIGPDFRTWFSSQIHTDYRRHTGSRWYGMNNAAPLTDWKWHSMSKLHLSIAMFGYWRPGFLWTSKGNRAVSANFLSVQFWNFKKFEADFFPWWFLYIFSSFRFSTCFFPGPQWFPIQGLSVELGLGQWRFSMACGPPPGDEKWQQRLCGEFGFGHHGAENKSKPPKKWAAKSGRSFCFLDMFFFPFSKGGGFGS